MQKRRIRVLVLAEEKALAEAIRRGFAGLAGLDAEVEVALLAGVARRQLRDVRYDLLVAERRHLEGNGTSLSHDLPPGLPVVAIGGAVEEAGGPESAGPVVPLPLSFSLFERVIRDVLGPTDVAQSEPGRRLRDHG
jgi:hypothetical protein